LGEFLREEIPNDAVEKMLGYAEEWPGLLAR
jgi:hypothetical protein